MAEIGGGEADQGSHVLFSRRLDSPAPQLVIMEGSPLPGEGKEITPVEGEVGPFDGWWNIRHKTHYA